MLEKFEVSLEVDEAVGPEVWRIAMVVELVLHEGYRHKAIAKIFA